MLSWTRMSLVYILATTAIVPSLLVAETGIVTAALGLVVRGRASFNRVGALMVSGFFLGVLGVFSWIGAAIELDHTVDVCGYSKLYPADPTAQWACPQIQASNQITWILATSLVIPALLFLVAHISHFARSINCARYL